VRSLAVAIIPLLAIAPTQEHPAPTGGPAKASARVALTIDAEEAELALALIEQRRADGALDESRWSRLAATAGYRRLKAREQSMGRPLEDAEFRKFLQQQGAATVAPLTATLAEWRRADLAAIGTRVLAYLPEEAKIRATVFPVVKPQSNSFVFETASNPAIFLFLDATMTRAQFENTVAHELHHIGFASLPARPPAEDAAVQSVREWAGAFGEGFAMLAAAGGPEVHPHADSKREDRERWDRDVARFDEDLARVERFFLDLLDKKFKTPDAARNAGFEFFGVQGPWYTVGWKMAVTVERRFGRPTLIRAMREPERLLATFDDAADELEDDEGIKLARWSPELLKRIGATAIPR
jgi:putative zinc-dependent peptidase DUF5700